MAALTFSTRAPEAIGRGPWTSHDSYELFLFLVQSCGIVCVGVFLYSLGPALGIAVLAWQPGGVVEDYELRCCHESTMSRRRRW